MYLSERDGDFYTCACGETEEHSYLLSSANGFISDCCRKNGWAEFKYKGSVHRKRPEETIQEIKDDSDLYYKWLSLGMPGYREGYTHRNYKELDKLDDLV